MSMQEVSGAKTETGHKNKDFGPSHAAHDWKDKNLVQEYLEVKNPFDYGQELCNVSDISVNVDSSEAIGENIISKIVGATAAGFSFKRKDQVVTMASKSAVKVEGEVGQVDPHSFKVLLLQGRATAPFHQFFLSQKDCCMSIKRQLLLMYFGLPFKTYYYYYSPNTCKLCSR